MVAGPSFNVLSVAGAFPAPFHGALLAVESCGPVSQLHHRAELAEQGTDVIALIVGLRRHPDGVARGGQKEDPRDIRTSRPRSLNRGETSATPTTWRSKHELATTRDPARTSVRWRSCCAWTCKSQRPRAPARVSDVPNSMPVIRERAAPPRTMSPSAAATGRTITFGEARRAIEPPRNALAALESQG